MRRIPSFLAVTIALWGLHSSPAAAQATAQPAAAQATGQPAEAQKPPAAAGEEGVKPTRGFVSALGHNLVDDVKHIPRRNSVYWLAGGTALALAVHPEDGKINRRLLGNSISGIRPRFLRISSPPMSRCPACTTTTTTPAM